MRISPINTLSTNNYSIKKVHSNRMSVTQPEQTTSQPVAFKGGFGALVGGVMGAVAGVALTTVTLGAASGTIAPLIAAGAAIGYSEEEKTLKEEEEEKKKKNGK